MLTDSERLEKPFLSQFYLEYSVLLFLKSHGSLYQDRAVVSYYSNGDSIQTHSLYQVRTMMQTNCTTITHGKDHLILSEISIRLNIDLLNVRWSSICGTLDPTLINIFYLNTLKVFIWPQECLRRVLHTRCHHHLLQPIHGR